MNQQRRERMMINREFKPISDIRRDIISEAEAAEYVVINDGAYIYPVCRADLRPGDTEEAVKAMTADEYAGWCQTVPMDGRHGSVGSEECIAFCRALADADAELWEVA